MSDRRQQLRQWLRTIIPELNRADVHYWIDFGTLLGAVREEDVIQWDLDADFSYIYTPENYRKILGIFPDIFDKNGVMGPHGIKSVWDGGMKLMAGPTCIDIYPWLIDGEFIKHPQSCFAIDTCIYEHVRKLEYIEFLGVQTKVPVQRHERLTLLYGQNYMTPVKQSEKGKPYWQDNAIRIYKDRLHA